MTRSFLSHHALESESVLPGRQQLASANSGLVQHVPVILHFPEGTSHCTGANSAEQTQTASQNRYACSKTISSKCVKNTLGPMGALQTVKEHSLQHLFLSIHSKGVCHDDGKCYGK